VMWLDNQGIASATRTVNLSGGGTVTITAYFLNKDPNERTTLNVLSDPATIGTFTYTLYGYDMGVPVNPTVYNSIDAVVVTTASSNSWDWKFERWENGSINQTRSVDMTPFTGSTMDITAYFSFIERLPKYYYITSSSDAFTTITPYGVTELLKGGSQRYYFSAADGNVISGVLIDGRPITVSQLKLGYFTFNDVRSNHTIEVFGKETRSDMSLTIDIKGNGYAEYSINRGEFVKYTGPVSIPEYADITLIAHPDEGYEFIEWRDGAVIMDERAISYFDVQSSIGLELYFSHDDSSSWNMNSLLWLFLLVIVLLILAGLIFWFLFYYKRMYEVIKAGHSAEIIGKERARRKKEYAFSVAKGATGKASYKVGENGVWKTATPNGNGEYVIPKDEVTDAITIEMR